jgi:hypothetical protein
LYQQTECIACIECVIRAINWAIQHSQFEIAQLLREGITQNNSEMVKLLHEYMRIVGLIQMDQITPSGHPETAYLLHELTQTMKAVKMNLHGQRTTKKKLLLIQ